MSGPARPARPLARRVPLVLCAMLGLLTAGLLSVASSGGAPSPPPAVVKVAVAHQKKADNSVPITRGASKGQRLAISMGSKKLPSLTPGDLLVVGADLPTSTDCQKGSGAACFRGDGYGYNPKIRARLQLSGGGSHTRIAGRSFTCRQSAPRNHHCPVVFTRAAYPVPRDLPCRRVGCRLELVIGASSGKARKGDRYLLGGTAHGPGNVKSGEGRLYAVRVHPFAKVGKVLPLDKTPAKNLRVSPSGGLKRKVILSVKVARPKKDAQLFVTGRMTTSLGGLRYATLVSSNIIVSCSPTDIRPCPRMKTDASDGGKIGPVNGFNCVKGGGGAPDFRSPCVSRKVGVVRFRKDAGNFVYVNFVAAANAKHANPGRNAHMKIRGGLLKVIKYGSNLRG